MLNQCSKQLIYLDIDNDILQYVFHIQLIISNASSREILVQ